MSVPDPYKVLQVDPEAEDEVIKAAYKRLARKYHPDLSADPGSVDRMVRINQAWEILRDPVRRAAVDRARMRAAGTSARVVATNAKAHAAARGRQPAPAPTPDGGPDAAGEWPIPGMRDPSSGRFSARPDRVSPNWTSGRSQTGSKYDTRSMGVGAAGAPPGNPSGSIVTFGRYEGWTLGEIARTNLEYLEWLDRMPIGRTYQGEIDALLRKHGRRVTATEGDDRKRGLFRRR